jgi:hypothetical protein
MGEMREYRSVSSILTLDMIRKTSLDPCPHPAQSFIAQESPKVKERTREISEKKKSKKRQVMILFSIPLPVYPRVVVFE